MPIYSYRCDGCGHCFDDLRSMAQQRAPSWCPRCHSSAHPMVALIARPRITESPSGKATSEVEVAAEAEKPRHKVSNVGFSGLDTAIKLRNVGDFAISDGRFGQDVRVAIETEGTKIKAERNYME